MRDFMPAFQSTAAIPRSLLVNAPTTPATSYACAVYADESDCPSLLTTLAPRSGWLPVKPPSITPMLISGVPVVSPQAQGAFVSASVRPDTAGVQRPH